MDVSKLLLESGSGRDDARAFRRALGHFGTGVAVITAAGDPHPVGVTVNSFSSVSLDPPLVLWSAANGATSLPAFLAASGFAVNVLASDQADVSARFAKSGGNKFEEFGHEVGGHGAPLLPGCVARFECRRFSEVPGGDHTIMIGEVERFARYGGTPLIFAQGRYGIPFDNPEVDQEIQPLRAGGRSYTFLTLLRRAYLARSSAFRREAGSAGLTVNESRVLYHLDAHGRLEPAALARAALMDLGSVEDAVRSLSARDLLWVEDDGALVNSGRGRDLIVGLRNVSLAAEARQVSGISDDDVRGARAVLDAFARPAPQE